jgi:hypothetical protein
MSFFDIVLLIAAFALVIAVVGALFARGSANEGGVE